MILRMLSVKFVWAANKHPRCKIQTLTSLPSCCDLQSRLCFHQPNLVSSQLVPKSGPKTSPANRLSLPLLHAEANTHIWWLLPTQQQQEEKLNCILSWNTICLDEMWFFFFLHISSLFIQLFVALLGSCWIIIIITLIILPVTSMFFHNLTSCKN